MARAILHLICGNCGCNDMWEWTHRKELRDGNEIIDTEDVQLQCKNCYTLHSLNRNASKNQST